MLLLKQAGYEAPKGGTPSPRGHIRIWGWKYAAEVFLRTKVIYINKNA